MKTESLLVAAAVLVGSVPFLEAQELTAVPDMERLLAAARKKYDVPALAAVVVRSKGPTIRSAVAGVRKRGSEVPATLTDQWHLGSDTKPMTAYLIALLIDMGLLDWDTTLAEVFPAETRKWPDALQKITVAQLLCHRSGLPGNWTPSWFVPETLGSTPSKRREAVVRALGSVGPEKKAGADFHYSNLGYVLLGAVAENKGKESYEDLMAKKVFGPLGMKAMGWGPPGKADALDQPWPHTGKGKPMPPGPTADNPSVLNSAGRVHAPLDAWALFCAEVLRSARNQGPSLLKPATRDRIFTMPFAEGKYYCLGGWAGQPRDGRGRGLFLGHDGSNTMNYCTAALIPDLDLAILVVCNQGGDPGRDACWHVRDALLKRAR